MLFHGKYSSLAKFLMDVNAKSKWTIARYEVYDSEGFGGFRWYALNKINGKEGPGRYSYDEAVKDIPPAERDFYK